VLRVYLKYGGTKRPSATSPASPVPVAASTSAATRSKRVQGGLGISIMTTPKGVMTGRQARREGVGGGAALRSVVNKAAIRDQDSGISRNRLDARSLLLTPDL